MKPATWLCLALLACAARGANPYSPELTRRAQEVVREIYRLDYERAAELARSLERDAPADPLGPALLARSLWSRQLGEERRLSIERYSRSDFFSSSRSLDLTVSPEMEDAFRKATASAIARANARLERNPKDHAARYSLGMAYQHLAAFEFSVKRKWWSAYRTGDSMFRAHKQVLEAVPEFPDAHFANGVSQYLADALPRSIKLFAVLFGFRGNRAAGLAELELVARDGYFSADDARTLLALLYARDKRYESSLAHLRELSERYPTNYLVRLETAGVFLQQKRYGDAIALYGTILARVTGKTPGYERVEPPSLCNRLGVAHRLNGELSTSAEWLEKALAAPEASNPVRQVSRLELGKTRALQGKRPDAEFLYRAVLAGRDFAGCHREAKALLSGSRGPQIAE